MTTATDDQVKLQRSRAISSTWTNNTGRVGSFINNYMTYMKDQETPRAYDYISALWIISALIGRWSYVPRPRAPVFLNMYAILVAESGTTRKSTAVSVATKLVREVMRVAEVDARLIENTASHTALLQYMSHDSATKDHTHIIFSVSELAAVLGRQAGTTGVPALLTDMYDCPTERRGGGTIQRGEYNLRNVYMAFIAASTPSWLARAVTPEIVEGGFTSRCLFIPSEKPKRSIPWPNEGSNVFGWGDMIVQLHRILDACPKHITLTEGALDIFGKWYKSRTRPVDTYRASFVSREDAHVLRVAALCAISDEVYEINSDHIRTAIQIVLWSRETTAELFTESAKRPSVNSSTSMVSNIARIINHLIANAATGVQHQGMYIVMKRYMSATQLRAVLEIMHELKMVQRFHIQGIGVGRPHDVWRATKAIADKNIIQLLHERISSIPERTTVNIPTGVEVIDTSPTTEPTDQVVDTGNLVKGSDG